MRLLDDRNDLYALGLASDQAKGRPSSSKRTSDQPSPAATSPLPPTAGPYKRPLTSARPFDHRDLGHAANP